jgi:hypothetical protein
MSLKTIRKRLKAGKDQSIYDLLDDMALLLAVAETADKLDKAITVQQEQGEDFWTCCKGLVNLMRSQLRKIRESP